MADFRRLPSLTQLRHLIALSDHRHFGHAAEACYVTQSSLSASIKELEATLGQVIIERTKRRVMPTPLGETVIERARDIVVAVEDMVDTVTAAGELLSGRLRLGVIPTISPYLLPRVLPTLRREHPLLQLYLLEDQTEALLARLGQGDLDVVLMAFPYPTAAFETWSFATDTLWLTLPTGHPLLAQETIAPRAFANEEILLLEEGHCLREHALGVCATAQTDGDAFATSLATLVQMAANGLGLTVLPKMAIDGGLLRGSDLAARPLSGPTAMRQIGMAWRPASPRQEEFRQLGEYFRDELATPVPAGAAR